jgi:ribosome modulation factor
VAVDTSKNAPFSRTDQRYMWHMGWHIRDAVEMELHCNSIGQIVCE